MSFIEKLQNKSRLVRIQILWVSVILVMSLTFITWLSFLNRSIPASIQEKPVQEEETANIPSLFGTLKEDFSSLKTLLQATVKEMTESGEKGEESEFEFEIIK